MGEDDVPRHLTEEDRWGAAVMARLDDGWCAALDRLTMLCTIYERRPAICRDYELGGSDCIAERSAFADSGAPGASGFQPKVLTKPLTDRHPK